MRNEVLNELTMKMRRHVVWYTIVSEKLTQRLKWQDLVLKELDVRFSRL
jgi:hypothetical protein